MPLIENRGQVFQGSIFLGDGFLLTHDDAKRMHASDPRNADVIMPIINGKELNSEPDQTPGRSIINFRDWPLDRAQEYREPFSIVLEKVKPDRQKQKDKGGKEFWWRFLRPRMEMVSRIHPNLASLLRRRSHHQVSELLGNADGLCLQRRSLRLRHRPLGPSSPWSSPPSTRFGPASTAAH